MDTPDSPHHRSQRSLPSRTLSTLSAHKRRRRDRIRREASERRKTYALQRQVDGLYCVLELIQSSQPPTLSSATPSRATSRRSSMRASSIISRVSESARLKASSARSRRKRLTRGRTYTNFYPRPLIQVVYELGDSESRAQLEEALGKTPALAAASMFAEPGAGAALPAKSPASSSSSSSPPPSSPSSSSPAPSSPSSSSPAPSSPSSSSSSPPPSSPSSSSPAPSSPSSSSPPPSSPNSKQARVAELQSQRISRNRRSPRQRPKAKGIETPAHPSNAPPAKPAPPCAPVLVVSRAGAVFGTKPATERLTGVAEELSSPLMDFNAAVGKAQSHTIRDPYVSRNHFVVVFHERQFVLKDIGSLNGTYVSAASMSAELARVGNAPKGAVPLKKHMRVLVGRTELLVNELTGDSVVIMHSEAASEDAERQVVTTTISRAMGAVIGRDASAGCTLVIQDPTLRARHCRVGFCDVAQRFYITDSFPEDASTLSLGNMSSLASIITFNAEEVAPPSLKPTHQDVPPFFLRLKSSGSVPVTDGDFVRVGQVTFRISVFAKPGLRDLDVAMPRIRKALSLESMTREPIPEAASDVQVGVLVQDTTLISSTFDEAPPTPVPAPGTVTSSGFTFPHAATAVQEELTETEPTSCGDDDEAADARSDAHSPLPSTVRVGSTLSGNFEQRVEMQDRVSIIDNFGGIPGSLFIGVFDGHVNRHVADFAACSMPSVLLATLSHMEAAAQAAEERRRMLTDAGTPDSSDSSPSVHGGSDPAPGSGFLMRSTSWEHTADSDSNLVLSRSRSIGFYPHSISGAPHNQEPIFTDLAPLLPRRRSPKPIVSLAERPDMFDSDGDEPSEPHVTINAPDTELPSVAPVCRCFLECFARVNELIGGLGDEAEYGGATATVCLLRGESDGQSNVLKLYVANIGDSKAVLLGRDVPPLVLTKQHKLNNEEEQQRIAKQGASMPRGAGLQVTRSFGDLSYHTFGLIAVPALCDVTISTNYTWLIVASDGFWDTMTPEELGEAIQRPHFRNLSPSEMAHKLVAHAKYSSQDNISIVAVDVNAYHRQVFSQE